MYQLTHRVRYSETDESGRLGIGALIDCFQDCAVAHSNAAGYPYDVLYRQGVVWVLNTWQADILRLPAEGEDVAVATYPHDFRGFFARRNFLLTGADGERLVIADSLWTTISAQSGAPVHVPEALREAYGVGDALEMDYAPRKIALPAAEGEALPPIPVVRHLLDINRHVNNAQYVRLAADCLDAGDSFTRLRVEYKAPARAGDSLYPVLYREAGRRVLALTSGAGAPYAVVEFSE